MSKKVIIISNRLPVTIKREDGELKSSPSAGGLATGLSSVYKEGDNVWLGWPGSLDFNEDEKQEVAEKLKGDNMAPVYLTEQDVRDFYEGFSNKTIWPLFHYFNEYVEYDQNLWEAYVRVNKKFADELMKIAGENDIIWVHDYQLLLLPRLIRQKLPNATIGFFQHIPFPSYEIFRNLPWRESSLHGMLGADLIGFHTYDDMRHFLSSVTRLLGFNNTMGKVKVNNRLVAVDAFPMGIDYEKFETLARSEETQKRINHFVKGHEDEKTIISIDRLDYTKGIKERLLGFDQFLEKYPEYVGEVSLIQIVVPSRVQVDQYQSLKAELDELVGRINGKHSRMDWTPIHYFYRSFDIHDLSALYSNADIALVTPLRDGMNLVCKEFIASKVDKTGVLILSEMAGAARELLESILVNPNDMYELVEALRLAMNMPEQEKKARLLDMQDKVKRYNVHRWVEMFMNQLTDIKRKQQDMELRLLTDQSVEKLIGKYNESSKRIIFLDYDGTLKPFANNPSAVYPDQELKDLLTDLAADEKNRVVVISGRDKDTLQEWLGDFKVDLIAEHGVWLKERGGEWDMIDKLDTKWKPQIRNILELFVDRTPGSFIEEKDYSLAWHYRKAETDFGELRARELLSYINYLISNMDLQSMEGNKVIEIKNRDVNKGKASRKWVNRFEPDFIIAIGDDVTDEDTFKAMPSDAFTIKVGLTPTAAHYNIKTPIEVRELIREMASQYKA